MSTVSNISISPVNAEDFVWSSSKENELAFRWLGQAGVEIFYKNFHLLIDPYLSDHLAKKYAGREFPHIRMMPSPIDAAEINDLDFILCTHRHSDHMDPETIGALLYNNPDCMLVAPRGETEHVLNNITDDAARVIFVNADECFGLTSGIVLDVIPSSHEELKTDKDGNHYYLGYILKFGDAKIYHSGDCVPYAGLAQVLKRKKIDMAMLPVNGRDEYRRSKGVPGNFSFEESIQLCKDTEVPIMICHHFGMFDFNTIDGNLLVDKAKSVTKEHFECIVPQADLAYQIAF